MNESDRSIAAVAALEEPARRRLYEFVASTGRSVGRDEAADGAGVSRALAAFHLDRLAELGLLTVEFRRLSGRSGRGAGRPNKLYRRAGREFAVQLPPRHYDLAADLMASAFERLSPDAVATLDEDARQRGRDLGRRAETALPDAGRDPVADTLRALTELGYEPVVDENDIALRNCPFHELAQHHRTTTCGMNLAMLDGVLAETGGGRLAARLEPREGWCCVRIAARSETTEGRSED